MLANMGEVKVEVKLVNALDEMLHRRQQLPADQIRSYLAQAVVDTGAVRTVIPAQVMEQLGLSLRGQRVACYADGRRESVGVTEPIILNIVGRDTLEEALVHGDTVLIGQTVLEKLDLWVDGAARRVVPNPAHPDQPVTMVR